jgi:hypothetical protein
MTGFIAVPATPPEVMDVKVNSVTGVMMATKVPVSLAPTKTPALLVVAAAMVVDAI